MVGTELPRWATLLIHHPILCYCFDKIIVLFLIFRTLPSTVWPLGRCTRRVVCWLSCVGQVVEGLALLLLGRRRGDWRHNTLLICLCNWLFREAWYDTCRIRRLVVVGGEGGYEYLTNTQQSIGWGFVGGLKKTTTIVRTIGELELLWLIQLWKLIQQVELI